MKFLLVIIVISASCIFVKSESMDYCNTETFSASCGLDEVIMIEESRYGRMRIGKCIQDDYGFGTIGCSANMTAAMHSKCSGTRLCEVPVAQIQLEVDLPCLKGTVPYLEANYNCRKVFKPSQKRCTSPLTIPVTTRPQYLSSLVSKDTSCGLQQTPYSLEAKPGQKISVTVESFTVTEPAGEENSKQCPMNLGYLMDTETDDVISLCGGRSLTVNAIHSAGPKVQVLLERSAVSNHNFLLKFEAKGCPEVVRPKYSWMKRQNNTVTLGCQSSTERWSLRCVGNIWLGIMKKCTPPPVSEATVPRHAHVSRTPEAKDVMISDKLPAVTSNHLFAVAIACVTIIICVTTVVLGIHCVKRYELSTERKTNMGLVTLPTGSLYRSLPVTNNTNTMVPAYTFDRPGLTVGGNTVNQRPESEIYNSLDRQPQLLA